MPKVQFPPMMVFRQLFLALVFAALTGCATQPARQSSVVYWEPNTAWYVAAAENPRQLQRKTGSAATMPATHARNLFEAKTKIAAVANLNFDLGIVDTQDVNAFAFEKNGIKKIAFTLGYLEKYGHSKDILGNTMGHEASHHLLHHTDGRRGEREKVTRTTAQILGTVANQFVPFSGNLLSVAITGVGRSFTRDEEREADEKGLELAHAAGFDICQGIQMWKTAAAGRDSIFKDMLSTHPNHAERLENLDKIALRLRNQRCDAQLGSSVTDAPAPRAGG